MESYTYQPIVNETQEFIEIANDFANPLDVVREAISNSYDANCKNIYLDFYVVQNSGESTFKIDIKDDGDGMNEAQIKAFFDLGNSTRKDNSSCIGEKGHGTKVYLNSKRINVTSKQGHKKIIAEVVNPYADLHNGRKPSINISLEEDNDDSPDGTLIEILGYNSNRRDKFTHENLKDHILWFTKHGGIDILKDDCRCKTTKLFLKGLDRETKECIDYGHIFPKESVALESLLTTYNAKAPDFYCKRIVKRLSLKNHPEVNIDVIFSIEGKHVKYQYNSMIRRSGYSAPHGSYTMQERYGLWLCKDYIPVQKKNEWVSIKGQEFTRFQAFVNCQHFKLTANRGSVENTPTELMLDIEAAVKKIFDEIVESADWTNIDWLEEEITSFQTVEKEKKNFKWRIDKIKKANIAKYESFTLSEPKRESGVFSIFLLLSSLRKDLFPFCILDYDTHEGVDVIVKSDNTTPITSARLFYVEFKYLLENTFNHSFENIHSIICWDTKIAHDAEVTDLNKESRKMVIMQPDFKTLHTTYWLENQRKEHRIQVYVLKDWWRSNLETYRIKQPA